MRTRPSRRSVAVWSPRGCTRLPAGAKPVPGALGPGALGPGCVVEALVDGATVDANPELLLEDPNPQPTVPMAHSVDRIPIVPFTLGSLSQTGRESRALDMPFGVVLLATRVVSPTPSWTDTLPWLSSLHWKGSPASPDDRSSVRDQHASPGDDRAESPSRDRSGPGTADLTSPGSAPLPRSARGEPPVATGTSSSRRSPGPRRHRPRAPRAGARTCRRARSLRSRGRGLRAGDRARSRSGRPTCRSRGRRA